MSIWNEMTVTRVDSIFTVSSPRGRFFEMNGREHYGLSFCKDGGRITYRMDGKEYVSDRTVAVLLPIGGHYTLHGDRAGEFPLINFECDLPPIAREIAVCPLRNPESYLRRYERMRALMLTGKDHAGIMSLLYDILADLAHEEEENLPSVLAPAIAHLGAHLSDPDLTVAKLSQTVNLSEPYFRKLFKEAYGTSPRQYLLELRIRQAKQLLSEKALTVTAISEACGFASVYHFCRAFKRAAGLTPTEYAARQLQG